MKYLLISPNKAGLRMFVESPPIGLAYLATALRKLGHSVEIIDCIIENWSNEKTVEYVKETKPDIVGINLFSTALASVKDLVSLISKVVPRPMILLGGPHCSGSPEHTLRYFPEVDYAFRGEAEIPIKEFHEFLGGKRIEGDVTGLIWRQGNKIVVNEPIEYANIEEFGFPAWDLIDPRKYFKQVNVGDKSINVHFSRGCPFKCRFCVKLGTKVRLRSIAHIWGELEMLNKEYGVERFIINDEGYTMLPRMVKDFCRHAIEKGNRFTFFTATGMRLNRLDDEMLDLMVKARHELVFGTGIESGVPRVRQDLMNKQLTQEELINGLRLLNKHGFQPVGNFIIGFPGETKKELKESVNFACKMYDERLLHGANFVPFLPLPGSEATKTLIESGELSVDYDFSKINLAIVAYAPKGMTIKELDKLRKWAVWKFNTRPRVLWRYLSDWGRFERAVITFIRIYAPNWLLPKDWRRV
jgi:radical SAM superfamily enzyme YgiQ (UPF0313 family)